jgi:hypothetical protein
MSAPDSELPPEEAAAVQRLRELAPQREPWSARWMRRFAIAWSGPVVTLIVGNITYIVTAESRWRALMKIRDDMSPFNITCYPLVGVMLAPTVAAYALAERLRRRAATHWR